MHTQGNELGLKPRAKIAMLCVVSACASTLGCAAVPLITSPEVPFRLIQSPFCRTTVDPSPSFPVII